MVAVIKLRLLPLVVSGMAIGTIARLMVAAPNIVLGTPIDIVRNDQVEPTIFVVIEPAGAGGPSAFIGNPCLGSNVGERSVAIIAVENRPAVAGQIQIGISVIIEITDGNALPIEPFASDAGLFGDIGECVVAIIAVKGALQGLWRFVEVCGRRLYEEDIHQAVLVEVEPGNARANGFQIILVSCLGGILSKLNPGGLGDIPVSHWNSRGGRGGICLSQGVTQQQTHETSAEPKAHDPEKLATDRMQSGFPWVNCHTCLLLQGTHIRPASPLAFAAFFLQVLCDRKFGLRFLGPSEFLVGAAKQEMHSVILRS